MAHSRRRGMRRNWKREAIMWRGLANVQHLAITAVARDPLYQCRCGEKPYRDGQMCPQCFCIYAVEQIKQMRANMETRHDGQS